MLSDIVGSTALAMTIVFSMFLLLLAMGAELIGRLRLFGSRALLFYGYMEISIAVFALVASLMMSKTNLWITMQPPGEDSVWIKSLFDCIMTGAIIALPVLLMGGTLPMILNSIKGIDAPRHHMGSFYGWNTLGAASGSLAAGFILIWKLGLFGTVLVAVSVNMVISVTCLVFHRRISISELNGPSNSRFFLSDFNTVRMSGLMILVLLSGFGVLGYEMLWGRIAKFILGDRTLAISTLLTVIIASLGLGSLISNDVGRRWAHSKKEFNCLIGWLFIISAVIHFITVNLARLYIIQARFDSFAFVGAVFSRIIIILLLAAPPLFVMGIIFPLMVMVAKNMDKRPGHVIGNMYFINTIGAVCGAFLAGLGLSRWIGTVGGFLVFIGLWIIVGAVLIWNHARSFFMRFAVCAVLLISGFWIIRFPKKLIFLQPEESLIASCEDEYGVQVLTKTLRNTMRVRNNRLHLIYELGHPQTAYAQQMAAHWTVLLADCCDYVLNIGTGYGITAGTFTLYPEVNSIVTVEILPFLLEHQPDFSPYHFDYMVDERVALIQGDGRHYLALSKRHYDIISVNVLDPYLPGSSSLYTVEFWKMARTHLSPGGVYTQLFWGDDIALLVKGLRRVFPLVYFFPAYGGTAYNIVAFCEHDPDRISVHWNRLNPKASVAIEQIAREAPEIHIRKNFNQARLSRKQFIRRSDKVKSVCHTDNTPVLEYRWLHGFESVTLFDSPLIVE